jgi:hypothetical protein
MVDANQNQEQAIAVQTPEEQVPEAKVQRSLVPLAAGGSLAPKNFAEMLEVAKAIAYSGMVPKDFVRNPGAVMVAMEMGAELGLAPMQALQNIAVINGRPGLWGDAVKALIISDPRCEDFAESASPSNEPPKWARCFIKRKGKTPTDVTFTVEDAKTAQVWGKQGPWTNYPRRMLQLRARSFACRDAFPDKLRGIGMAEELEDIPAVTVDGGVAQYSSPADIPEGTHKLGGARKAQSSPAPTADPPGMDPKTGEVVDPKQAASTVLPSTRTA